MITTKPQEFFQASIDKSVNMQSLAAWCEQEGLRMISTRRGFIAIEPLSASYNGRREAEQWKPKITDQEVA